MIYTKYISVGQFCKYWQNKGAVVVRSGDIITTHICGGKFDHPIIRLRYGQAFVGVSNGTFKDIEREEVKEKNALADALLATLLPNPDKKS